MPSEYWIDMTLAPERSPRTALGFQRNAMWFWQRLLAAHLKLFTAQNQNLIRSKLAPQVDAVWIKYHPLQNFYFGDTLVHHHVEQSYWAAGIPKHFHSGFGFHRELHPATYEP